MKDMAHKVGRVAVGLAAGAAAWLSLAGEAHARFTGPGVYVIESVNSRKVLDVDNSWWRGDVAGMPLIQWGRHGGANQQFRIVADVGGSYTIRPVHSGQCLNVRTQRGGDGADVEQSPCRPSPNNASQRFYIGPVLFLEQFEYIQAIGDRRVLSAGLPGGGDAHHDGARILLRRYSSRFDDWRIVNTQFRFHRIGS